MNSVDLSKNEKNKLITDCESIISNAGIGIWHIIFKDGKKPRMQVNRKMAELLAIQVDKFTEEEIYSGWIKRITPEAMSSVQASIQEMMSGKFSENTFKWIHPSKGIIFVRCGGTSEKLEDGTTILSGYYSDVTNIVLKEQRQKQQLQISKQITEAHNRDLSKQMEIIKSVSKAFNVIYYVDLSDYSFFELGVNLNGVEEVIGSGGDAIAAFDRMCSKLVHPESIDKVKEFTDLHTIKERLKDKSWISCQFNGILNGWSEGIFIAANRDSNGEVNRIIWATKNIDESKRKEIEYQNALEKAIAEAKSANEAKSNFLFNMSHDIRTPMNAIIGYTDLLEKHHSEKEKCYDYMEKIRTSSDFLLSLINNVLEMARIESGKATLDETVFETGMVQREIASVYSELFKQKKITFTRSVEVQTHYIYGDVVKLKEIYLNIVSNSLKYTPENGSVEIKTVELPSDISGYAHFRTVFSDTGIGMSEEYIPHIFDEFSREKTVTEDGIAGTGLGMPIVKKLIEMMNGTIKVQSKPGMGTSFTIELYHRIGEKPKEKAEHLELNSKINFKGKRILLAEDNDLNAEIATVNLEDVGLEVERAEDGIICVDKYTKAPAGYYDLILMDIQMPNMNGYKATRIIRGIQDKEKNQIPIIAMTANAFEEDKKDAINAGMNEHLAKPIVIADLMEILRKYLG